MHFMDRYIWNYGVQFGAYLRQVSLPTNDCGINWPYSDIKSAKTLQDYSTMRRDQSLSLSWSTIFGSNTLAKKMLTT
jgi:hypothetical protein